MAPRRRGRSTRASAIRTPTPQLEISDGEMADAPSGLATPAEPIDDNDDEDADPNVEDGDDDDAASPDFDGDLPPSRTRSSRSQVGAPVVEEEPTPPPQPVKRRPGRPPKNRPVDWDAGNAASDNTPKRRGGFRGRSFGGGRWKNRGGPSRVSQVPLDKEGNMATVRDDEVELPEDPEGEAKVDKMGYLKEGREYRVRTFTIQGRGERLYMLSTEPARCIGFRDSYLFFQKHKQLFKIILMDEEKMDLIDRELMPHSYKGRAIGVVTARSVFREFGAKIIIGGKKVTDDYQASAARANGEVEGELAVPEDILPAPGRTYDRNRYVAWHGASNVYHNNAPTVPMQNGKEQVKKRKVTVTGINWQFEHAREASRFNSSLVYARRQALDGVYDMHTNAMHYPQITQPTHVRWEQVPPAPPTASAPASDPTAQKQLSSLTLSTPEPTTSDPANDTTDTPSTFPTPNPFQQRNLLTVDTHYTLAPLPNPPIPGPDGDEMDIGPKGLVDVSEEIWQCLPEECRAPFAEARQKEAEWRSGWGNEAQEAQRAKVKNSYGGGLWT